MPPSPIFIIYLGGKRIAADQEVLIKEIFIQQRFNLPSSFTLTLAVPRGFKRGDLEQGQAIEILIDYRNQARPVFTGEILSTEASYSTCDSDAYIFTVKGMDRLHRLKRGEKNLSFSKLADSDVIAEIIKTAGLKVEVDSLGAEKEFILQKNISDFDFLHQMALKHSCFLSCQDKMVLFKKLNNIEELDVVLEWGKTLMSFNPRSKSQDLPTELEVRGWDPTGFQPVLGTAGADDINFKVGGETLGLKVVQENFGTSKAYRVDESITDIAGAEESAANILTDISLNYIKGWGKCPGNPDLKVPGIVSIQGVEEYFTGPYLLDSVEHRLHPLTGYQTSFSVKRNAY